MISFVPFYQRKLQLEDDEKVNLKFSISSHNYAAASSEASLTTADSSETISEGSCTHLNHGGIIKHTV